METKVENAKIHHSITKYENSNLLLNLKVLNINNSIKGYWNASNCQIYCILKMKMNEIIKVQQKMNFVKLIK